MERMNRMGKKRSASQIGAGMRIVSMKQVVGIGEERVECGPKPSGRWVQSIFLLFCSCKKN